MNARAFLIVPLSVLFFILVPACGDDDDTGGGVDFAFGLGAEVIASGGTADSVSSIAFAPDGRIFYAEQYDGAIQIILADGTLQPQPFTQVSVAQWLSLDWGITGLTLDPDFETNHYVYAFYTEPAGGDAASAPIGKPVIVRFTEVDGAATDRTVIVDDLPLTDVRKPGYNANGDLRFGPDGMLYASLGDYDLFSEEPDLIDGLGTVIGKILRLNPDGTAPTDNPLIGEQGADPRVFASGFREPFTFNWGPDGTLYSADNTTVTCEELNIIEPGGVYGWPRMGEFPFADCGAAPGEQAIFHFTRGEAAPGDFLSFVEVSGLSWLQDTTYTQLTDGLIVCEGQKSAVNEVVTAGVLRRVTFADPETVSASELIVSECKGDAAVNAGVVYYSTATELKRLTTAAEGDQQTQQQQPTDGGQQQTPPNLEQPSQ